MVDEILWQQIDFLYRQKHCLIYEVIRHRL